MVFPQPCKYIGNVFPIGISQYLLYMCSELLVTNLDIMVLWFTSTKVKLIAFLQKLFDRYIHQWHRVFCFGHFRWDKPFYKAWFEFDPHVTGLIFGRFYSRYSVIFPMPKSIFFSQFSEENSQFQVLKNFWKQIINLSSKSWLKNVCTACVFRVPNHEN